MSNVLRRSANTNSLDFRTERSLIYRKETVLVQKIWGDLLEAQPSRIKKSGDDREKCKFNFLTGRRVNG